MSGNHSSEDNTRVLECKHVFKLLFSFAQKHTCVVKKCFSALLLQKTDIPALLFHFAENHFALLHTFFQSRSAKIVNE